MTLLARTWMFARSLLPGSLTLLGMLMTNTSVADPTHKFIITESGTPSSYDPLDADSADNLPLARMIYLTPLEVSGDDRLTSTLLKSFSYDSTSLTATWIVREGLNFSDGTPITPDDVAFAVARMAHRRPGFPVIMEIAGIDKWVHSVKPLYSFPEGIKVDGQAIKITFTSRINHPLFRFCLELFSVIPRSSVDQDTGRLKTKQPPTSGYYVISSREDSTISFTRRPDIKMPGQEHAPKTIKFIYVKPQDLLSQANMIDDLTIAATNEALFKPEELKTLVSSFDQRDLPKAKFRAILINPDAAPFKNKMCRQIFAQSFREEYAKLMGSTDAIEGSISPKVVTGYAPLNAMTSALPAHTTQEIKKCLDDIARVPIKAVFKKGTTTLFQEAVKNTLVRLGQPNAEPIAVDTFEKADQLFLEGKAQLAAIGSGLWALDPFGDLQMLFTAGLHAPLVHLQRDSELQKMLATLRTEMPPAERVALALKVNQHLFEDATFNVYTHTRRFYLSKKGISRGYLQASITSPAPWQLFAKP